MSKSIAGSLEKEIENRVPSALDHLRLDMGTTDQGAIPKDEDTHLTHSGKKMKMRYSMLNAVFQTDISMKLQRI